MCCRGPCLAKSVNRGPTQQSLKGNHWDCLWAWLSSNPARSEWGRGLDGGGVSAEGTQRTCGSPQRTGVSGAVYTWAKAFCQAEFLTDHCV